MVRVNLLEPRSLSDQHLIAEYDEILMLLGYVKKYPMIKPGDIPERYTLGKGHIKFFKDKLLYLKHRHELLKKEMRRRGFRPEKTINTDEFPKSLVNNWSPTDADKRIIRARIIEKLRKKPDYYRYFGEYKNGDFFSRLIEKSN
jgi:deoxyribonuclease (pyrimidine dimer)